MNATAAQVIAEREELTPDPDQLPAGQAPRSRQHRTLFHPAQGGNVLARRLASPVIRIVAASAVPATGRAAGLEPLPIHDRWPRTGSSVPPRPAPLSGPRASQRAPAAGRDAIIKHGADRGRG